MSGLSVAGGARWVGAGAVGAACHEHGRSSRGVVGGRAGGAQIGVENSRTWGAGHGGRPTGGAQVVGVETLGRGALGRTLGRAGRRGGEGSPAWSANPPWRRAVERGGG